MNEREEMMMKEALMAFLKKKFSFAGTPEQSLAASYDITDELFRLVVEITKKK